LHERASVWISPDALDPDAELACAGNGLSGGMLDVVVTLVGAALDPGRVTLA
jgi:hypothetical protein